MNDTLYGKFLQPLFPSIVYHPLLRVENGQQPDTPIPRYKYGSQMYFNNSNQIQFRLYSDEVLYRVIENSAVSGQKDVLLEQSLDF